MTKLAIMGAMEEEITPLLAYFTDIKKMSMQIILTMSVN